MVRSGELILTNFINGNIEDYKKVAHVVLATLLPSIDISDISDARPLSSHSSVEGGDAMVGRVAVSLSSPAVVNRVLHARSGRTRFSSADLNPALLDGDLASRVKQCKIFVNEALPKDKFKLFCNLRSIAKGLGFKYVWHRGGKFFVKLKGGERAHEFASHYDLHVLHQALQSRASQRNVAGADSHTGASVPAVARP